jgi:hypothetical protein
MTGFAVVDRFLLGHYRNNKYFHSISVYLTGGSNINTPLERLNIDEYYGEFVPVF